MHAWWPATFPSGQGSDLAGVVAELGSGVSGFAVGDEVIGFSMRRSSHAEYVTLPANQLTPRPSKVSCAPSKPLVKSEISMLSIVCARANSFPGPRRAPRRSANLSDLPRRVLGTQWVRAKWAWTTSLLSTQSFACMAFWVYAWRSLGNATDYYGARDKRVGSHDCWPRRPADSRLTTATQFMAASQASR